MVPAVRSSNEAATTLHTTSTHPLELGLLGERLSAAVLGSASFDGALLEVMRIVCDATNWALAQAWMLIGVKGFQANCSSPRPGK